MHKHHIFQFQETYTLVFLPYPHQSIGHFVPFLPSPCYLDSSLSPIWLHLPSSLPVQFHITYHFCLNPPTWLHVSIIPPHLVSPITIQPLPHSSLSIPIPGYIWSAVSAQMQGFNSKCQLSQWVLDSMSSSSSLSSDRFAGESPGPQHTGSSF